MRRALQAYRAAFGAAATDRLCAAFAAASAWLLEHGHGECTLHAANHQLGHQLTIRSIYTVSTPAELAEGLAGVPTPCHGEITVEVRDAHLRGRITVKTLLEIPTA